MHADLYDIHRFLMLYYKNKYIITDHHGHSCRACKKGSRVAYVNIKHVERCVANEIVDLLVLVSKDINVSHDEITGDYFDPRA